MPQAPEGDVADIAHTPFFHREHAPIWLSATLNALGYAAPALSGSRFLDPGCGDGLSLTLLAAANPDMHFTGVDASETRIAAAGALARAAGLANLEFHRAAIGDFAAGHHGEGFDFIVSHGVYAWVPAAVRRDIRKAFARLLKAGGVAYLHYMSHPGSAPFMAFRNLFHDLGRAGLSAEKAVDRGLSLLEGLRERGAGFFVAHPHAVTTLADLRKDDPADVAHEYLVGDFEPQHASAVMRDMEAEGFSFAGSATPVENIDALSLPANVLPLVAAERDPFLRETLKDMARNQLLRRDLYLRDPKPLSPDAHFAALRRRLFRALPGAPARGGLTFDTRIGPVEGAAAVFSPILERLAQGPARYAEIKATPPFATRAGLLNQALHVMMWAGIVHPVPEQITDPAPARRLNAVLLERHRAGEPVPALAVPAIASGLACGPAIRDALAQRDAGGAEKAALLPVWRSLLP